MDVSDDNILVQRTLAGDSESYRVLVDRYKNALFNLAYRLTGDRESAEDLAQEAFVRAYEHLGRFDQKRRFFSWLYTICTNLGINEVKKRGRRRMEGEYPERYKRHLAEGHGMPGAPGPPDAEQAMEEEENRQLLNSLLAGISPEYRTPVMLRYQEELPYQEIAEIMGISVALAKVRVHRGIEKLRALFRKMVNRHEG